MFSTMKVVPAATRAGMVLDRRSDFGYVNRQYFYGAFTEIRQPASYASVPLMRPHDHEDMRRTTDLITLSYRPRITTEDSPVATPTPSTLQDGVAFRRLRYHHDGQCRSCVGRC